MPTVNFTLRADFGINSCFKQFKGVFLCAE